MRRGTRLSRESVVEASMRLARENGLDGVTMRAVAAELGVTPMALYYHVDNKDQLVQLIADEVLAGTAPLQSGADWESTLRDYLHSRWEALQAYPGLASYMIDLEEAGFDPDTALLAWSFALTYLQGRLSVDARFKSSEARVEGLDRLSRRAHAAFGFEAVVVALRAIRDDPSLVSGLEPIRSR
jgi:AcrR family transcriptional regulator